VIYFTLLLPDLWYDRNGCIRKPGILPKHLSAGIEESQVFKKCCILLTRFPGIDSPTTLFPEYDAESPFI